MATEGLYPLSTQDGKAIPLDIVKPKGLAFFNIPVTGSLAVDAIIPTGYKVCWLYATQDCIIKFSAVNLPVPLVEGTNYEDAVFIPAQTPIVIAVTEGEASLVGLGDSAGILYINHVEQWAAMLQRQQVSIG